jgi:hypothetical protein
MTDQANLGLLIPKFDSVFNVLYDETMAHDQIQFSISRRSLVFVAVGISGLLCGVLLSPKLNAQQSTTSRQTVPGLKLNTQSSTSVYQFVFINDRTFRCNVRTGEVSRAWWDLSKSQYFWNSFTDPDSPKPGEYQILAGKDGNLIRVEKNSSRLWEASTSGITQVLKRIID